MRKAANLSNPRSARTGFQHPTIYFKNITVVGLLCKWQSSELCSGLRDFFAKHCNRYTINVITTCLLSFRTDETLVKSNGEKKTLEVLPSPCHERKRFSSRSTP